MTHQRLLGISAAFVLFMLIGAGPAAAQTYGARVGVSASPDQFYFGAHVETRPILDRLRFRPNLEIGVGDDVTVTALNFEFAYHFDPRNGWNVYAGGGPALNILNFHPGDVEPEGGFNVMVGVQHESGLFVEVKAGAIDSPNFKFAIGYTFHK